MTQSPMRDFITGILRDMQGNALLLVATGRTEPTEKAPHGKLIVNSPHWFAYPAELDLMVEFAETVRSGEQRNAYLSPLVYGDQPYRDRKSNDVVAHDRAGRPLFSRAKENALQSQTVYMDSDACPPEAFRLPPSRHVETSPGHGHDYWFLAEPVPASVAAEVAHRITTAHHHQGSDPSGWSANKVLRLPTVNTTYDQAEPFAITWEDNLLDTRTAEIGELVYNIVDIQHAYADVEVDAAPGETYTPTVTAPVPDLEGLPSFESLVTRIPQSERRLNDLIYKNPDGKAWRSEQRFALLLDLQRFGFSDEETIAVAWHSPAASKWREDARGVDGLWWELQAKVKPILAEERGEGTPPAPAVAVKVKQAPKLLTPTQRARVESRSDLLTLYIQYGISKVQTPNMPYHIINGWTLLTLGLSEAVELPKDPGGMGTGLYSFSVGKSSTGKDESMRVLMPCVNELYPNDPVEIPANGSRESLISNLIERDNRVTFIRENEADDLIEKVRTGAGYMSGMDRLWTRAYDGEVPSLGKVGNKDVGKAGMHAIPVMHFMGTPSGILAAIDKKLFYSGWLARQIWVIGDDVEVTEDSMRSKFRRGDAVRSYDGIPRYLGLHFAQLRARLRATAPLDRKRAALEPTDEALEMVDAAKWKSYQHLSKEHDLDLWSPVLKRMGDIIWKVAGLSAASDGRTIIGTRDAEVALYYAEVWIGNAMVIADSISDTFFSKQCDDIEKFIAGREGEEAEIGAIYRHRKAESKRMTDEYIQSLVSQGRIYERPPVTGQVGAHYYKIKGASR